MYQEISYRLENTLYPIIGIFSSSSRPFTMISILYSLMMASADPFHNSTSIKLRVNGLQSEQNPCGPACGYSWHTRHQIFYRSSSDYGCETSRTERNWTLADQTTICSLCRHTATTYLRWLGYLHRHTTPENYSRYIIDPNQGGQWYLNTLDMTTLWEDSWGESNVRVAVIDSGIDITTRLNPQYDFPYDAFSDDDDPLPTLENTVGLEATGYAMNMELLWLELQWLVATIKIVGIVLTVVFLSKCSVMAMQPYQPT